MNLSTGIAVIPVFAVLFISVACGGDESVSSTATSAPETPPVLTEPELRGLLRFDDVTAPFSWLALEPAVFTDHSQLIGDSELATGLRSYSGLVWHGDEGSVFLTVRQFDSQVSAREDIEGQKPRLIPGFSYDERHSSFSGETVVSVGDLSFQAGLADARAVMVLKGSDVFHIGTRDLDLSSTSDFEVLVSLAQIAIGRLNS